MTNLLKGVFFLLIASLNVSAQSGESLLIGPGDVLHIQVFDTPELEQHARVTDSGILPLLLCGELHVSGLGPAQVALLIEGALRDQHFLQNPKVAVTVDQYATQRVSILGEVRSPGAYAIDTPKSIVDVLALAGGLTEGADRNLVIQRHGNVENTFYYFPNRPGSLRTDAITINPGDAIIVPRSGVVYVLGDVGRAGGYTMTNNYGEITVLEVIARAGGTNHSAVPSHAILISKTSSGYTKTPLPLSAMQKGKAADVQLHADDIVYVPFSYIRNVAIDLGGLVSATAGATIYHF
jgi:polysaccharide export outer membrane protein